MSCVAHGIFAKSYQCYYPSNRRNDTLNEMFVTRVNVSFVHDRRGGVEVDGWPRMLEIGVRSPVGTDLSRKNR